MQIGLKTRCYPEPFLDETLSFWVDGVRSLKNAKTADEKLQFWMRKVAILSPSWTDPDPQRERVIDQTYSQYKDEELSPWLLGVPSQLLRNRTVEHHAAWQNHFRDPQTMKVPTFQAKGERDTLWLTKELFRVKAVRCRWLVLEIGTEAKPVGLLKVRLHRPAKGCPVVVPAFDSIHLRRLGWGGWTLSGSYEDGKPTTDLETVLARVRALPAGQQAKTIKGVDRGVKVPLALSDGRLCDLPESAQARIGFLEGKIKHLQRHFARQTKGSKRRLANKARIARYRDEVSRLVEEFLCQTAALIASEPGIELAAFEGLRVKNMTRKPKARFDSARGRYLRNGARAKAGLNRSFLRVAPGKAKQRMSQAMTKRGKGFLDVTAAYSSQECAKCHHIEAGNRKDQTFKCLACGHEAHADTNAAQVVQQRALKAILDGTVLQKQAKKMVTGRKVGQQKAAILASQQLQGTLGAGPSVVPANNTAGAAERARPDGGCQQAPVRLGVPAKGAERTHPRGKGHKTNGAKAPGAAFGKRETPSSNHALSGRDHASRCG